MTTYEEAFAKIEQARAKEMRRHLRRVDQGRVTEGELDRHDRRLRRCDKQEAELRKAAIKLPVKAKTQLLTNSAGEQK